jgi:hypothetical protein
MPFRLLALPSGLRPRPRKVYGLISYQVAHHLEVEVILRSTAGAQPRR